MDERKNGPPPQTEEKTATPGGEATRKPLIVCISGSAGHGKDTFARMVKTLAERDKLKVLVTHYADLLKYMAEKFFDWDGKKDERGRSLLQHIGTELVRDKYPDFWTDFLVFGVDNFFGDRYDLILIPDCRFPNEIECWDDAGYETLWCDVTRPGYDNGLTEEQKRHPSETALSIYREDPRLSPYDVVNDKPDVFLSYAVKVMDWVRVGISLQVKNHPWL